MPTTPSSPRPLDYPLSNASSDTPPHYFQRERRKLVFPRPSALSYAVGGLGERDRLYKRHEIAARRRCQDGGRVARLA
ncbi:hypothetical protein PO909_014924 [Leuciscus waleckii]